MLDFRRAVHDYILSLNEAEFDAFCAKVAMGPRYIKSKVIYANTQLRDPKMLRLARALNVPADELAAAFFRERQRRTLKKAA